MRKPKRIYHRTWTPIDSRKGDIGGSDIASIRHCSSYSDATEYRVQQTFIGNFIPKKAEDDRLILGHLMESVIKQAAEFKYGIKIRWSNRTYRRNDKPWMRADLDGIFTYEGRTIIAEYKNIGSYRSWMWGEDDTDDIPEEYLLQCLWYLIVTGFDEVWLFRYTDGQVHRYIIRRDEDLLYQLESEITGWVERVRNGYVPEMSYEEVRAAYPMTAPKTSRVADEKTMRKVQEWEVLDASIKKMQKVLAEAKGEILKHMDGAEILVDEAGNKLASNGANGFRRTARKGA